MQTSGQKESGALAMLRFQIELFRSIHFAYRYPRLWKVWINPECPSISAIWHWIEGPVACSSVDKRCICCLLSTCHVNALSMLIWRRSVWQILESHHLCLTPAMLNRFAAALKGNHHSLTSYWEDDEDPVTNLSRQIIPQRTGASSHDASCWAAHAAGWEGPWHHQVTLAQGKSLKSSSLDCGSPCSVWMWLVARHFSYEEGTGETYMLKQANMNWTICRKNEILKRRTESFMKRRPNMIAVVVLLFQRSTYCLMASPSFSAGLGWVLEKLSRRMAWQEIWSTT